MERETILKMWMDYNAENKTKQNKTHRNKNTSLQWLKGVLSNKISWLLQSS